MWATWQPDIRQMTADDCQSMFSTIELYNETNEGVYYKNREQLLKWGRKPPRIKTALQNIPSGWLQLCWNNTAAISTLDPQVKLTWHMFSFMEAGPPRSPMIFLEGKSGSSHSDKSSFMEEKLWSKLDGSLWRKIQRKNHKAVKSDFYFSFIPNKTWSTLTSGWNREFLMISADPLAVQ